MEVKPLRWAGLVGLACLGAAVALLPFPRQPGRTPSPAESRLASEVKRLQVANGRRSAAIRGYHAMDALSRWRAAPGAATSAVVVDASVPASIRPLVDSAAREAWHRLGATAIAERAAIFVYVDTATIIGGVAIGNSRPTAETFYALPEATGGRCVTLVRLTAANEALLHRIAPGPCGFFAAFGPPGRRVGDWLGGTRYAMARQAAWGMLDEDDGTGAAYGAAFWLSSGGAACLVRESVACLRALGIRAVPAVTTVTMSVDDEADMPAGVVADVPVNDWELAGASLARLFSDMVRDLGPARFAAFWTSDAAPDVAFERAAGRNLAAWTHDWLSARIPVPAARPWPAPRNLVWLAITLPLLAAGAAGRRRERLLAAG